EAEIQFGGLDCCLRVLELTCSGRDSCFRGVDLCFRVSNLCACRLDAGPLRIDLRFRGVVRLKSVVEILLSNCLLLGEWPVFFHVEICLDMICLCLFELCLCL